MDVKETVKTALNSAGQYGSGVVGLGAGTFAIKQMPGMIPAWAQGALTMAAAWAAFNYLGKNEFVKAFSLGLGSAGALALASMSRTMRIWARASPGHFGAP